MYTTNVIRSMPNPWAFYSGLLSRTCSKSRFRSCGVNSWLGEGSPKMKALPPPRSTRPTPRLQTLKGLMNTETERQLVVVVLCSRHPEEVRSQLACAIIAALTVDSDVQNSI